MLPIGYVTTARGANRIINVRIISLSAVPYNQSIFPTGLRMIPELVSNPVQFYNAALAPFAASFLAPFVAPP